MFNLMQIASSSENLLKKIDLVQKGYDITVINPLTNKPAYDLNPDLILKQHLTKDDVALLQHLHQQKIVLFHKAEHETDLVLLRALAEEYEQLNYHLQEVCHFPRNADYHRWFDFPKCTCSRLENEANIGKSKRIFSSTCIIHSHLV